MLKQGLTFNEVVESLYNLSTEEKQEIKTLLDGNIKEEVRNEFLHNYKAAKEEHRKETLRFSKDISKLRKML